MMKIFGRMTSMYLSFTHMVPLNPMVSLILILEMSTYKNGLTLILEVNIDEIRYVLINTYNANTEVEQVQVLSELSKLMKNMNYSEENHIVSAGYISVFF